MITTQDLDHSLSRVKKSLKLNNYSLEEGMNCILRLLLLKRLSDQLNMKIDGQIPAIKKSPWIEIQKVNHNLAKNISEVLINLEASSLPLKEVFKDSDFNFWNRFDDETLNYIIQNFSELDLSDQNLSDMNALGEACENFIEKSQETGMPRQEIYTPRQLTKMLVKLTKPGTEMSIYDPACGSGGFLAASAQFIKSSGGNLSQANLYGQNENVQESTIAKINLILHDVDNPKLRVGNAILKPQFIQNNELMLFDIVLTNPPFGYKFSLKDVIASQFSHRFSYGFTSKGDYLFIQHALSCLKDTGKAAIILPLGVLFRGGSEKEIRKKMIDSGQIEAVIALAPNLFYHNSIPVLVMILSKKAIDNNHVLMIDASHEYKARKRQNYLQPKHIEHIVSTYHDFKSAKLKVEEGFSRIVSVEEIAANGYDLRIDRYFSQTPVKEFNIDVEINKLQQLEARRSELKNRIDTHLRVLGIRL